MGIELKDTMLSTTDLIAKIKAETRYEDAGQGASPLFLRSDNSGRFRAMLVLFRLGKDSEKKSVLKIEQVLSFDIYDGNRIEHEPAVKFFDQMGIDVRNPIYPARKEMNKDINKQYRDLINTAMDQIRLSIVENGDVSKEKYLEYLNYALYSYSDDFAKILLGVSRIFEFTRYAIIRCQHCNKAYKVNASGYTTGQLITSKCPNCQDVNRTEYKKEGKTHILTEAYMTTYRIPMPEVQIPPEPVNPPTAEPYLDTEASYAVETHAQIVQNTPVGNNALTAYSSDEHTINREWENITESSFPEKEGIPDTDADEKLPDSVEKSQQEASGNQSEPEVPIYGLGNVKRIFRAINTMPASAIPKIYALCGEAGQGIQTSIYHMTSFPRNAICITDTENITAEQVENFACCVIYVKTPKEMLWLYDKLNRLSTDKTVFLVGNAATLSEFYKANPAVTSLVLYTILYKPYTVLELYNMLRDRLNAVHLTISLSDTDMQILQNQNALSVKGIANRIYFKRLLADKNGGDVTATEIEKELPSV